MSQTSCHKVFIITGELSGEIHAARLVESFSDDPGFVFSAVGSQRLAQLGVTIVDDYRNISVMGISEVISRLHHIHRAFKTIREYLRRERPDLVVLVDFPGFNLKMARYAKKLGIPVVYFIPPQIWAWKPNRIHTIKKYVDLVICILPFEEKLFASHGIPVVYVGHPFVDTVKPSLQREEFLRSIGTDGSSPIITILPGSRKNEIRKHMSVLLQIVEILRRQIPNVVVVLPLAESIDETVLEPFGAGLAHVQVVQNSAYNALSYCDVAIASSGSVTLEAAILRTPTIVIYQISRFSYFIAKLIVKVDFISLPNIIAHKEVFPEFIQDLDPEKIAEKALYMVQNGKELIERDLAMVIDTLGSHNSYAHARDAIIGLLGNKYGTVPETAEIS